MKKLLIVVHVLLIAPILFNPWTSWGTVYYVDCAADGDAGAGTSTAANVAWKTIAKVNGETFAAGDNVLFNNGCTWRESLVVPSSGSSGSPITFSSYGTGNKPKILGSVTPTSWTAGAAWQSGYAVATTTNGTSGGKMNYRMVIPANSSAYDGSKVRISFHSNSTGNVQIDGVSIGAMTDNAIFDSTPTRVQFSGDNAVTILQSAADTVSDNVTFTWDHTKRYGVNVYQIAAGKRKELASSGNYYGDWTTTTEENVSGNLASIDHTATTMYFLCLIEVYSGTDNVWYAVDNITSIVGNLIFDNEASVGVRKSTLGALGTAGDFFYNATDNHVYLYNATIPSTAYTGIEIAKEWNGAGGGLVYINGKNYVTIDGLDIRYSGSHGVKTNSAVSGITIQNNSISYIGGVFRGALRYGNGIEVWMNGDISNINLLNNAVSQTYDECITFQIDDAEYSGIDVDNVLVGGNTADKCGRGVSHSMINVTGTNTQDNVVYEYNSFTNNGRGWAAPGGSNPTNGSGQGALLNNSGADTMTGCFFRNNTIDNTATTGDDLNGNGLFIDSGGGESWTITRNLIKNARNQYMRIAGGLAGTISYNLMYGAVNVAAIQLYTNSAILSVLNNTIVKTSGDDVWGLVYLGLTGADNVSNLDFKNNIIYDTANGFWTLRVFPGDNVTLSNNLYYDTDATTTLAWNETDETGKVAWEALSGETGSVWSDPLFVSTVTPDFSLQAGSPARNAGTDVGLTTDYLGNAIVGLPDIGAYEYQPTQVILVGPIDNVTGLTLPITFDWEDFDGAIKYELMVDNNSDWSSPEIDVVIDCLGACDSGDSTYEADDTELDPGTHYYWRVRALQ